MRFLHHDDLKAKGISYSKPHLWRLIQQGRFPAPVRGLGQQNVWAESEIDEYIAQRVAEREEA